MSTHKYLVLVVVFQLYWSYSKRAPVNLFEFESRIFHVLTLVSIVSPNFL